MKLKKREDQNENEKIMRINKRGKIIQRKSSKSNMINKFKTNTKEGMKTTLEMVDEVSLKQSSRIHNKLHRKRRNNSNKKDINFEDHELTNLQEKTQIVKQKIKRKIAKSKNESQKDLPLKKNKHIKTRTHNLVKPRIVKSKDEPQKDLPLKKNRHIKTRTHNLVKLRIAKSKNEPQKDLPLKKNKHNKTRTHNLVKLRIAKSKNEPQKDLPLKKNKHNKTRTHLQTWKPSVLLKPVSVLNEECIARKRKRRIAKQTGIKGEPDLVKINKLGFHMRKSGVTFSEIRKYDKISNRIRRKLNTVKVDPLTLYNENDGSDVSSKKVSEAVQALLKLLEENETNLFSDEGKDIYLQITSFKVPATSPREVRVVLPHSILPKKPDVCLFCSDLQKGKRIDHEPTLEQKKNFLKAKGVTEITEVITLRQLKTEYDQYELKRALCSRYDVFFSEAKVCGHISHLLGKTFYKRRKVPIPVNLDANDLKQQIQKVLHKSSFRVNNSGTIFTLKVAHTLLTPEQICENIMAASNALRDCFPGGWNNVLQLMVKGAKSLAIPFYLSTMKDSDVGAVIIKPLRPKAAKGAIGELPDGTKVLVLPEGDVKVLGDKGNSRKRKSDFRNHNAEGVDEEGDEIDIHDITNEEEEKIDDVNSDDGGDENNSDNAVNDKKKRKKTGLKSFENAYLQNLAHEKIPGK